MAAGLTDQENYILALGDMGQGRPAAYDPDTIPELEELGAITITLTSDRTGYDYTLTDIGEGIYLSLLSAMERGVYA